MDEYEYKLFSLLPHLINDRLAYWCTVAANPIRIHSFRFFLSKSPIVSVLDSPYSIYATNIQHRRRYSYTCLGLRPHALYLSRTHSDFT